MIRRQCFPPLIPPRGHSIQGLAILIVLAGLLLTSVAGAQSFGRVKFIVTGPDGKPLPDAKITVTTAARTDFIKEVVTNKRGSGIVSLVDATLRYTAKVEHPEYRGHQEDFRAQLRGTIDIEIRLQALPKATEMEDQQGLTPAQEIFNEAVRAAQSGDDATARTKLREAVELDPDLGQAHAALAGYAFDDSDFAASVASAQKAASLGISNARLYRLLYEAHTKLGNAKEAQIALDTMEQFGENCDAAMYYNQGVSSFNVGDNADAKINFLKALELEPEMKQAKKAMVRVYLNGKSYSEAAGMAESYLAQVPDDQVVLQARWEIYGQLGDEAKEKEALDALAAVNPEVLANEFFKEGAKFFDSGDVDEARAKFENVLAIQPEHARAHYQLGLCHVNNGENALAKEHFQKFIEIAPDDPEAAVAKEMLSFLE